MLEEFQKFEAYIFTKDLNYSLKDSEDEGDGGGGDSKRKTE